MGSYIAIDLKSFYASVECAERGLDPLTANLVVADAERTEKTICLAVSPSLKAYGIPGRARLFEVMQRVREINAERRENAPGHVFTGASCDAEELRKNPSLELDFIAAPPQMARYVECSAYIYQLYLKYIAPEDIHVYSIDEVFIDAGPYLAAGRTTARELAGRIVREVLSDVGITATVGIGTNLYLAKIAMDLVAKHIPPDGDGVRVAELDEDSFRRQLWTHRPLTDFWRIGRGVAARLERVGLYTMGDIARCSLGGENDYYNEALLYQLFGVNAELLIDHAWGWEPCKMADIKSYRPQTKSISTSQVLTRPYEYEEGRLIVREMSEQLALDLVEKGFLTEQLTLAVGYDTENLNDPRRRAACGDGITADFYGRSVPKHTHASGAFSAPTASGRRIVETMTALYERIVNPQLLLRRITVAAGKLTSEYEAAQREAFEQLDLFSDPREREAEERERQMQKALLSIRRKYGKNAILRGMDLRESATARERNGQIGGHRA